MRNLIRRLFKKKRAPEPRHALKIPGLADPLAMAVHPANDEHISTAIAQTGIWEPEETRFMLDALEPGDTFVDVGANIGYFTLLASRLVGPKGSVYAFEPDPDNYRLLAENCAANHCKNAVLHEAALSDQSAKGELYLSESNMGDHTIYPLDEARASRTISLIRGSELFPRGGTSIDFLKIDTQGSEYQVIEGLSEAIESSLPDLVIMVEFSPNSVKKTGHTGAAFLDLFAAFGGHFYILDSHHKGIIPISRQQLKHWISLTEMDPDSEGFINLIFSGVPLENKRTFKMVLDLGFYDNALEYLLGNTLLPWNGAFCAAEEMQERLYFASGWSFFEDWGTWSDGRDSLLKFFVSEELKACLSPTLVIRGRYFGEEEETVLEVNNIPLGAFNLREASIPLPEACMRAEYVTIHLKHRYPVRPVDAGDSNDERQLKFGIESLAIEGRSPSTA